eukprot:11761592-Ditylum_brightwellii.AAC.1
MSCQEDWTFLPPMWTKRTECAAVSIGGQLYAIGVCDIAIVGDDAIHSSIEVFNTATGKWTSLPSMSIERFGCAAVGMGGNLYVIGGSDDLNNVLSSTEVFNTSTREWTVLPPMSTKRYGCAAVGMGGNLY